LITDLLRTLSSSRRVRDHAFLHDCSEACKELGFDSFGFDVNTDYHESPEVSEDEKLGEEIEGEEEEEEAEEKETSEYEYEE